MGVELIVNDSPLVRHVNILNRLNAYPQPSTASPPRFHLGHPRQTRSVDTSPPLDVLLETVASTKTSTRNAHSTRRPQASGDPPRTQPQELLAYVQDHCQRRGADECVARRTRTAQLKDALGQACSPSLNRRMRTRMSGGVGGSSARMTLTRSRRFIFVVEP